MHTMGLCERFSTRVEERQQQETSVEAFGDESSKIRREKDKVLLVVGKSQRTGAPLFMRDSSSPQIDARVAPRGETFK